MVFIKEDAKKMADLLRTGHKMLNLSCPICNNPIFQNKDGISFCVICNREVIMADSVSDKNIEEKETILNKNNKQVNIPSVLITVLTDKLNWITQKLKKENQLDIIEKYLKILFDLLNLLEKAKGFQ
ncbi:unnamed protein product [marine sediment metagenome]|uniref:Sjogrens syndrome scleroderma autoantigen 1 n=1 Tax=marine sediment metagenome TaxID=412755 RepID=X1GP39_9ZZZZ